jgi:uncharacterized membrane protein
MATEYVRPLLAVGALLLAAQVQALPQYKVINLGGLGPDTADLVRPWEVSNAGVVVGITAFNAENHAFTYSHGKMSLLLDAEGRGAPTAYDINDRGQIVGEGDGPYLYENGTFKDLGAPLGGHRRGGALGINAAGTVVGQLDDKAAVFENGQVHFIATPGAGGSVGNDINDHGVVIGNAFFETPHGTEGKGFIYEGGTLSYLTYPDGHTPFIAYRLNNAGQVLGYGELGGFINDHGHFIGVPSLANGTFGSMEDLNDRGWVVGYNWVADQARAILFRDGRTWDLNDLVRPGASAGLVLNEAIALNDRGWIVGRATLDDLYTRAFLAVPVPEPGSGVLMLAGLAGLGLALRQRQALRHGAAGEATAPV